MYGPEAGPCEVALQSEAPSFQCTSNDPGTGWDQASAAVTTNVDTAIAVATFQAAQKYICSKTLMRSTLLAGSGLVDRYLVRGRTLETSDGVSPSKLISNQKASTKNADRLKSKSRERIINDAPQRSSTNTMAISLGAYLFAEANS
jgi:hypothetical protein